ncbi:MAG: hypothetical protein IPI67_21000 [Myxococcales bacterium]|nr:hypothetical protein [Myxococcales bacterium]
MPSDEGQPDDGRIAKEQAACDPDAGMPGQLSAVGQKMFRAKESLKKKVANGTATESEQRMLRVICREFADGCCMH